MIVVLTPIYKLTTKCYYAGIKGKPKRAIKSSYEKCDSNFVSVVTNYVSKIKLSSLLCITLICLSDQS